MVVNRKKFYTFAKIFRVIPLNEYIIPITGIKDGLHVFDYDVNKSFIQHFEYSDISDINAHIHVNFYKNNRLFNLEINVQGEVVSSCDRCLDDVNIPIDFTHSLIFKLDNNTDNVDEDIIFLPLDTTEIDLSIYIYEAIVFSIPMRRVHGVNEEGESLCNKEMIDRLNSYLEDKKVNDPRWDELKKLLN